MLKVMNVICYVCWYFDECIALISKDRVINWIYFMQCEPDKVISDLKAKYIMSRHQTSG